MKEIKGFEGLYQISPQGIVKAFTRIVNMPNGGVKIIKEHYPKLSVTHKGYLKVMLTNSKGNRKGHFVHRLVISTFLNESNLQVNHKDGNKQNNDIVNLEYVTTRQNQIHRIDKTKTTSRLTGVTRFRNKWQSQKMINGKRCYLGLYNTEIEAHNVYLQA